MTPSRKFGLKVMAHSKNWAKTLMTLSENWQKKDHDPVRNPSQNQLYQVNFVQKIHDHVPQPVKQSHEPDVNPLSKSQNVRTFL